MKELEKIKNVIKKVDENAPHEVLLVLDATTGQNALSQAKAFNDVTEITGIVLTKLDGTAKGVSCLQLRTSLVFQLSLLDLVRKSMTLKYSVQKTMYMGSSQT